MTPEQAEVAFQLTLSVAETIRRAGQIPSGHIYATLMGVMDVHTYNKMIDVLVNTKLVKRLPSHMLVWIGPDHPPRFKTFKEASDESAERTRES